MTIHLRKGRYLARQTTDPADIAAARALRTAAFDCPAEDNDPHDARCTHILIEDTTDGTLVCTYRLFALHGADVPQSYAAQFYELSALQDYEGLMMELGRFCVAPDRRDPDILRVAWAALTEYVDAQGVQLLYGCSTFAGEVKEA